MRAPGQAVAVAVGALALDAEEHAALREELRALLGVLREPAARASYAGLAEALAVEGTGELVLEHLPADERLLELALGSGRARRVQGPEGEQALLRLFHRTPRGAALKRAAGEANRALAGLVGQTLRSFTFSPRGPGTFQLEIATDLCQIALEIGRAGIAVDSVGIEV